jgi:predicted Fe-Mo cluster-binding NifX family protein
MKILLTATKPDFKAQVDPRFGRCAYLLVADTQSLEWQAFPNPGASAPGGAGIQAAQFVANQEVEAVISGEFGPNAFDALKAADIQMYRYGDCRTVQEAVQHFLSGQLQQVNASTHNPNKASHQRPGV